MIYVCIYMVKYTYSQGYFDMYFVPILASHVRFTIVSIYLQKYFLNKVDGRWVGTRPESSLGFSLIFLEKFFFIPDVHPHIGHPPYLENIS